jgi:RNA polymerase sigma-70 factor (ECF subfamily)
MTVTFPSDMAAALGTRAELSNHCRRLLGSSFDAEDAVQETLIRAWKGINTFEGRSSLRTWLYRIATNVCFDTLQRQHRQPRTVDPACLPYETTPRSTPRGNERRPLATDHIDPAERVVAREQLGQAFVTTLRCLPPRQRAVLILRDVMQWQAKEVARFLGTTAAAVNASLQRARATLAMREIDQKVKGRDDADRCVDAFERRDIATLVRLLEDDRATLRRPAPRRSVGRAVHVTRSLPS